MTTADWALLVFGLFLLLMMPLAIDADHDAAQWFKVEQSFPGIAP